MYEMKYKTIYETLLTAFYRHLTNADVLSQRIKEEETNECSNSP